MNMKVLPTFVVILYVAALCIMPAMAVENTQPVPPQSFFGTVTVNGALAPAGTVIEVKGVNVQPLDGNPFTLTQAGVYGVVGFDDKLLVQGNITPGTPLEFYVNGQRAKIYNVATGGPWQDTFPFEPLGFTELNIWVGTGVPPVVTTTVAPSATSTTTSVTTTQTSSGGSGGYYTGGSSGGGGSSYTGYIGSGGPSSASATTTQSSTQANTTVNQTTVTTTAAGSVTSQNTQVPGTTSTTSAAGTTSAPEGTTTPAGSPLGIGLPVIALACIMGYLALRRT